MYLYHGTSLKNFRKIISKGIKSKSYVTSDIKMAVRYADIKADLEESKIYAYRYATIVKLYIPVKQLYYYVRSTMNKKYLIIIRKIPSKYIVDYVLYKFL